jgi:hypothetical protein
MQPVCDICGKDLEPAEVKTIGPTAVVNAARGGYVPKAPTKWKAQLAMLGIPDSIVESQWPANWSTVVQGNTGSDWGLCSDCLAEVERFNSR